MTKCGPRCTEKWIMDHVSLLGLPTTKRINLIWSLTNTCYATDEKYPQGWPRLASFLDGCSNFSIFRRFGHCATRILVSYTAKITMLEKQLHELDRTDALPDGKRYRLRNLEIGPDTFKEDLVASIESHLRKYCK